LLLNINYIKTKTKLRTKTITITIPNIKKLYKTIIKSEK